MAAAAAGVVVTPRLALAMRADFITATGEMAQHALPDGSIAALNTDSALALDFAPGRRAVRLLKGEAEFTVVPGAGDFTVLALDGRCALAQGSSACASRMGRRWRRRCKASWRRLG